MYMYFQFRRAWLSLWYVHTYIYMNIYLCICVCMYMYIQFWRPWLSSWSNDSQRGNRATQDIQMCDMTHLLSSWSNNGQFGNHVCGMMCVARLIQMFVMSDSDVCHDSFRCVPWLIQMYAMAHSCVWHDSFRCVPWLIYTFTLICVCAMTHSPFLNYCHQSTCTYSKRSNSYIHRTVQWLICLCHHWISFPYFPATL